MNHSTSYQPVATPPECFTTDTAFLRTIPLYIDTYCTLTNKPAPTMIEDWWASHLGTITVGDFSWIPALSFHEALRLHEKMSAT